MASFKILDIFARDGQLVVKVEHYNPDNTVWFMEHYIWQGREGLKQKRATNALGQPLMDNGLMAPSTVLQGSPDLVIYLLPLGRTWLRRPGPYMVDDSILNVIRSIHQQRLASGWPSRSNRLSPFKHTTYDDIGVLVLITQFMRLVGWIE